MNDQAQLGVVTVILLIVFLLIGVVSASVLLTEQTTISEEDLNHMTDEIVDELCSFLQIKQIIGKYQILQGQQAIQQVAVLIKPLVTQDIDISSMTIILDNGDQLQLLFFNGSAASIGSHALFDHPLWGNTSSGSFNILTTIDDDNSIIRSHIINKNNDMAFILIKVPENMTMQYGDQIKMTLMPSPGVGRTVLLEPPMPMKNLVTLYE